MIASAMVLFPEPDSPTSASVSPEAIAKLTSRKANTRPARVA